METVALESIACISMAQMTEAFQSCGQVLKITMERHNNNNKMVGMLFDMVDPWAACGFLEVRL